MLMMNDDDDDASDIVEAKNQKVSFFVFRICAPIKICLDVQLQRHPGSDDIH
jgi:hypothetical protein